MLLRFLALACLALAVAGSPAQEAKGNKVAVVVGVNDYRDELFNLHFAENDADELNKVLRAKGFSVTLLTTRLGKKDATRAPTAANIRAAVAAAVKEREKADTVLICLAGHGMELEISDPEGKEKSRTYSYFCPHDFSKAGIRFETGNAPRLINLNWLFGEMEGCSAGRKIVLVDACRNRREEKVIARYINAKTVTVPNGVCALFSCSSGQVAYEVKGLGGLGHGVFFHFVLEGLRGKATDREGAVTWSSLTDYVTKNVESKVHEEAGRKQTPHQVSNFSGAVPVLVAARPAITKVKAFAGEAAYQRGLSYLMARGVTLDQSQASAYLKEASDAGHPLAQGRHALYLFTGTDVEPDKARARRLIASCLADVKRAARTHPDAMFLLGRLHAEGLGVEKDEREAVRLYRQAAEEGYPAAMCHLGLMYEKGLEVEEKPEEAVRWYRKAADKGFPQGLHNLGVCYAKGQGVEKDEAEAVRWYLQAAKKGQLDAMNNLGHSYAKGAGVGKDEKEAVLWYRKAADKGHLFAMTNLGVMYLTGQGVKKDEKEAAGWFRKAAARGHAGAKAALERLGVKP